MPLNQQCFCQETGRMVWIELEQIISAKRALTHIPNTIRSVVAS
jgi:hypothetical protein